MFDIYSSDLYFTIHFKKLGQFKKNSIFDGKAITSEQHILDTNAEKQLS